MLFALQIIYLKSGLNENMTTDDNISFCYYNSSLWENETEFQVLDDFQRLENQSLKDFINFLTTTSFQNNTHIRGINQTLYLNTQLNISSSLVLSNFSIQYSLPMLFNLKNCSLTLINITIFHSQGQLLSLLYSNCSFFNCYIFSHSLSNHFCPNLITSENSLISFSNSYLFSITQFPRVQDSIIQLINSYCYFIETSLLNIFTHNSLINTQFSKVLFQNSSIKDNGSDFSFLIQANQSNVQFSNVTIEKNSFPLVNAYLSNMTIQFISLNYNCHKSPIFMIDLSFFSVLSSNFSENLCSTIFYINNSKFSINKTIFERNSSPKSLIYINNSTINVSSNLFNQNTPIYGSLFQLDQSKTYFSENNFNSSSSRIKGSSISSKNSNLTIQKSNFSNSNSYLNSSSIDIFESSFDLSTIFFNNNTELSISTNSSIGEIYNCTFSRSSILEIDHSLIANCKNCIFNFHSNDNVSIKSSPNNIPIKYNNASKFYLIFILVGVIIIFSRACFRKRCDIFFRTLRQNKKTL